MTFDLTDRQATAREAARRLAEDRIAPLAAAIDRAAQVPPDLAGQAAALVQAAADQVSLVVVIEELAAASGAVALVAASDDAGARVLALAGLRGGAVIDEGPGGQLILTAVTLGLARTALDRALADLREAARTQGRDNEKPHWVVADVATELDAARLLAYHAAAARSDVEPETAIAMARLTAMSAAAHAVDAALRLAGAGAYAEGQPLERIARDVRAVSLLMGTEEDQRATAARGLLPL